MVDVGEQLQFDEALAQKLHGRVREKIFDVLVLHLVSWVKIMLFKR